jgi:hypothetical protein
VLAALLVALGEDPRYVMGQLGHTDPKFTLRLYAQEMHRHEGHRDRLRALVEGADWAPMGTKRESEGAGAHSAERVEHEETPRMQGFRRMGDPGLEIRQRQAGAAVGQITATRVAESHFGPSAPASADRIWAAGETCLGSTRRCVARSSSPEASSGACQYRSKAGFVKSLRD